MDGLVISLDGSRQEIDAIHRGKEHFDKTIKIIDQYRKNTYPFKLKVNTVMTKSNFFCKTKGSYNHIEKRELIDKENFLKKINELEKAGINSLMYKACKMDVDCDSTYTVLAPDGNSG